MQEKGAELVKSLAESIAHRKNNNGVEFDRWRDKGIFRKEEIPYALAGYYVPIFLQESAFYVG